MSEIHFILVEPAVPGNIGASARAIKVMGFSNLRLVNPCDHLDTEARMLAHGANDILENASIHQTLEDALSGLDYVIGTSARKKTAHYDYYQIRDIPGILGKKSGTVRKTGIVFGREESGLSNEEFRLCHIITYVPLATSFPSLNLSQAVMLYAYVLNGDDGLHPGSKERAASTTPPSAGSFRAMMQKTGRVLEMASVRKGTNLYHRIMERLAMLGSDDVHLVHSVCNRILSAGQEKE